jgi:hypothetical protein
MMKFIIIHGVPGGGKTTLRKERYPDLPYRDIDDLRKLIEGQGVFGINNYYERMNMLVSTMVSDHSLDKTDVVIEGIFAPGTDSHKWLTGALYNMGAEYEFVRPDFTLFSAAQYLVNDYGKDHDKQRFIARMSLLLKYINKF